MRFREPIRSDFETEEEYEYALSTYEDACEDYLDWYMESRRERE